MTPSDIERAWKQAERLVQDIAQLRGDAVPASTLFEDLDVAHQRASRCANRLERAVLQLSITLKDAAIAADTAQRNAWQADLNTKPQT
jgi:hypothetical protein